MIWWSRTGEGPVGIQCLIEALDDLRGFDVVKHVTERRIRESIALLVAGKKLGLK